MADDAKGLTTVCWRLLPEVTETAWFGGDLTAAVAGMPSVRVAELLDSTADREINGTASVWRFSADSVRLALYADRTARTLDRADRHRRRASAAAPVVSHRRQRSKANEGDIIASSRSAWPGCVTR
ncbi:hypothetical protein [Streptomyces cinereoruber]|uniref:hypothetical protein n=1 Tax=Streptomyces cinereoruber TaxID=67260 RepID=UPI00363A85D5